MRKDPNNSVVQQAKDLGLIPNSAIQLDFSRLHLLRRIKGILETSN